MKLLVFACLCGDSFRRLILFHVSRKLLEISVYYLKSHKQSKEKPPIDHLNINIRFIRIKFARLRAGFPRLHKILKTP